MQAQVQAHSFEAKAQSLEKAALAQNLQVMLTTLYWTEGYLAVLIDSTSEGPLSKEIGAMWQAEAVAHAQAQAEAQQLADKAHEHAHEHAQAHVQARMEAAAQADQLMQVPKNGARPSFPAAFSVTAGRVCCSDCKLSDCKRLCLTCASACDLQMRAPRSRWQRTLSAWRSVHRGMQLHTVSCWCMPTTLQPRPMPMPTHRWGALQTCPWR